MMPDHILLRVVALLILFASGCTLDREGGLTTVTCEGTPAYTIDSAKHRYRGSGTCKEASTWELHHYELSAVWEVADKRFTEIFKLDDTHSYTSQSYCTDDPVLYQETPCVVTNLTGTDPKAFFKATGLVITPQLDVFPLSKVIAPYAWTATELAAMRELARNAPPPSSPPPPPPVPTWCSISDLSVPPKIILPSRLLSWLKPEDVTFLAKVNCKFRTDPSLPPSGCLYIVEKEEWDNLTNGYIWIDVLGERMAKFDVTLTGPQETFVRTKLGLTDSGEYRIKARVNAFVFVDSNTFTGAGSVYGDWVYFTVNPGIAEIVKPGAAAGLEDTSHQAGPAGGKTKLKMERMWTVPARPRAGAPFKLNIAVVNRGTAPVDWDEECRMSCTSLGGGRCPEIGPGPRLGHVIATGASPKTLTFENLRFKAGQYRLTINCASPLEGKPAIVIRVR